MVASQTALSHLVPKLYCHSYFHNKSLSGDEIPELTYHLI